MASTFRPPERALGGLLDVGGMAVQRAPARLAIECGREAELRGDRDRGAERLQGLADELLVDERPVDLRRVEERHPAFDGGADQRDQLWTFRRAGRYDWLMPMQPSPSAETWRPLTECAGLHGCI